MTIIRGGAAGAAALPKRVMFRGERRAGRAVGNRRATSLRKRQPPWPVAPKPFCREVLQIVRRRGDHARARRIAHVHGADDYASATPAVTTAEPRGRSAARRAELADRAGRRRRLLLPTPFFRATPPRRRPVAPPNPTTQRHAVAGSSKCSSLRRMPGGTSTLTTAWAATVTSSPILISPSGRHRHPQLYRQWTDAASSAPCPCRPASPHAESCSPFRSSPSRQSLRT